MDSTYLEIVIFFWHLPLLLLFPQTLLSLVCGMKSSLLFKYNLVNCLKGRHIIDILCRWESRSYWFFSTLNALQKNGWWKMVFIRCNTWTSSAILVTWWRGSAYVRMAVLPANSTTDEAAWKMSILPFLTHQQSQKSDLLCYNGSGFNLHSHEQGFSEKRQHSVS